jgi:hypothetical protein
LRISVVILSIEEAVSAMAVTSSGVAVALDDLVRDGIGRRDRGGGRRRLDVGPQVGERADRARQLSDAHVLARPLETRAVASHLLVPERELETERDRLGVDAVRAADHHRVAMLEGAPAQRRAQRVDARDQEVRRLDELHRESVSTTSLDVSPRWMKPRVRPHARATEVRKAMTSWRTFSSIRAISRTSKPARALMTASDRRGTTPRAARASHTAISTSSHRRKRFSSDQMRPISGRV